MNPDPAPDQELASVMKQIEAMNLPVKPEPPPQSQALSGNEPPVSPLVMGTVPTTIETQPAPPAAPDTQPAPSTPVLSTQPGGASPGDVVQVKDREGRYYGMLFTIGAIQGDWVHGYVLKEQGGKDFITVRVDEVYRIGPAKVKSRVPCSKQWNEQYGREQ